MDATAAMSPDDTWVPAFAGMTKYYPSGRAISGGTSF